jgi:alpha,alpha-trehalose phosphorylase
MIRHDPILPPEFIYPIDDWRWVEAHFDPDFTPQSETTFSTANGYLGMRGGFQEGHPSFLHGTFVNGFHEAWPIPYGEKAFGFAKTGQTMVNLPDGKIVRLYVDDEPFTIEKSTMLQYERALNFKRGTYEREILWETPSGKKVRMCTTQLVSFSERHVAAIHFEVTVLNARAPLVIVSEMVNHAAITASSEPIGAGVAMPADDDPRLARSLREQVLDQEKVDMENLRVIMGYRTKTSRMSLACGMEHSVETENHYTARSNCPDHCGQVVFSIDAEPGRPFRLTKYLTYHTSGSQAPAELRERAVRTLERTSRRGFGQLLEEQQSYVQEFWDRSDIQMGAPGVHPRLQQTLRWNLFQLLQATGRVENAGVPAKGLTGQAYEGHYFWDMEIYVLPFLIYTAPRVARNLLIFRHGMLDKARERAADLNQQGALFPWRTISGEEASAYYAAGTAQYHINAAIAYSIKKYVEVTGDDDFLREYGAEMLVETARLWYDLGFFSERQGNKFCIHGVTGPDEYTTVVNNNAYTNLMARENLWYAANVVDRMREQDPRAFAGLAHHTRLSHSESADWRRAADQMLIPYDERTKINPQDDDFLDREVWDLKATPKEKFPLLLHYHPLVIYRHQVIKQTDVVFATVLLPERFTAEERRRIFEYYDPLTTGDSSLSECIQAIAAADVGKYRSAEEYLVDAVALDIADTAGNLRDGVHVASAGGTWMAVVYGFARYRWRTGDFAPLLPTRARRLHIPLQIQGSQLVLDITEDAVTYSLRSGQPLTLRHYGTPFTAATGAPRSFAGHYCTHDASPS